jgi:DNA-binding NarL/FixJ family response regulator
MKKNMAQLTRIAIVDDDAELVETIKVCLARDASVFIVGSYSSGEGALDKLSSEKPDVVLMDINMQGMGGIECVRRLKKLLPLTHVVMLTVFEDTKSIFQALANGASGYLLKHHAADLLIESIREVMTGGAPMSPTIARMVVKSLQKTSSTNDAYHLTDREIEVLNALGRGLAYKQIADELGISLGTIRTHIERVYQKLHVHSRTDAVVKYMSVKGNQ